VQLLECCREHGRMTVATALELTGANRNTVKDHLKRLTSAGHLVRHGAGRGTWYALAPIALWACGRRCSHVNGTGELGKRRRTMSTDGTNES